MHILTTEEQEMYISELYNKIKPLAQADGVFRPLDHFFSDNTLNGIDGSFSFSDNFWYYYGVNEHGRRTVYFKTDSLVELVFHVMSSDILWMAHDFERKNRIDGEDSRRQLFQKVMDYWNVVGGVFAARAEQDIKDTLVKAPFDDSI